MKACTRRLTVIGDYEMGRGEGTAIGHHEM